MGRIRKILNAIEESGMPPIFAPVMEMLNNLIKEKLVSDYVIGGSLSIMYYSEPFYTEDVDIFCYLPSQGKLFTLGPIWKYLESQGCKSDGGYMVIRGVKVQFLPPSGPLEEEAMATARVIKLGAVPAKIFELEYAIAIKVSVGRTKDWLQIETAKESANINMNKLESILKKFNLLDKWVKHNARFQ